MEPRRKAWNEKHKMLRQALHECSDDPTRRELAVALFLEQHAMMHSAMMHALHTHGALDGSRVSQVAAAAPLTFDDEMWQDLDESVARRIPRNEAHSVAWCIWHMARIEDVTMNVLLAGEDQCFVVEDWPERLRVGLSDTGNAMTVEEIAVLSANVDLAALSAYRAAVGQRTRQIVQHIQPADIRRKVQPERLQRLLDEGAVCEASRGLLDYWGGLTVAGLLLMPPTRHNLVHLNEAIRLKS